VAADVAGVDACVGIGAGGDCVLGLARDAFFLDALTLA
jgi:hypothetical protein